MRSLALGLAATVLAAGGWPSTVPESTEHKRTSTVAEVRGFMEALRRLAPALHRYQPPGAPLETEAGAPLLAWYLPATGPKPLRVYINANIHAGEVEGKEAVQLLVRELLKGEHAELRRAIEFVFMPCYNADGTDALDPAIRRHQPNPEESGVGRREDARGLDLNRDLMKARAANTRWFLAMLRNFDPDAVFDLHTTDGSYHGFHLTYAPSLALGADPELLAFNRRMLGEVRDQLQQQGLPTYDYGNFGPKEHDADPKEWRSFEPFPRYLSNYPGLEGRLGILSEAYVYRSFPERIADTHDFVLGCLGWLAEHKDEVQAQVKASRKARPEALPLDADFAHTEDRAFEVVVPELDKQGRVLREKSRCSVTLPSFVSFTGKDEAPLPQGYLIDPAYAFKVRPELELHGIRVLPGSARPKDAALGHFVETGRSLAKDAFQGIFALDLKGRWAAEAPARPMLQRWSEADLDRALYVPLDQPAFRVAFYLLDPRSPDGLVHWGFFHESLVRSDLAWGEPPRFPILAVGAPLDDPNAGAGAQKPFTRPE